MRANYGGRCPRSWGCALRAALSDALLGALDDLEEAPGRHRCGLVPTLDAVFSSSGRPCCDAASRSAVLRFFGVRLWAMPCSPNLFVNRARYHPPEMTPGRMAGSTREDWIRRRRASE